MSDSVLFYDNIKNFIMIDTALEKFTEDIRECEFAFKG